MSTEAPAGQIGPQLAEFPGWLRDLFLATGSKPELLDKLAILAIPTGQFAAPVAQIGGRPAVGVSTQALLDLTLFQGAGRAILAGDKGPLVAWREVMKAEPFGFVVLIVNREAIDRTRWDEIPACGIHLDAKAEPPRSGLLGDLLGGAGGAADSGAAE